jgi:CRP-like cAMP-binding protein
VSRDFAFGLLHRFYETSMPTRSPENRLLALLPSNDFARITSRMTRASFGHKDLLYRCGGPLDYVYFPRSGMLSAVVIMNDGQIAESSVIGREGMLGAAACIGAETSSEQVFCQVCPAECWKMLVGEFVKEVAKGGKFKTIIHNYLRSTLAASARYTACNCLHSVDERCARWLLLCHDGTGTDQFTLTHEFLAIMLGVRRATVTVTARALQSEGIITYRRGKVKIINRAALEKAACECHRAIHDIFRPPS